MVQRILILLWCILPFEVTAQQQPAPIGVILMSRGQVQANDNTGNVRNLVRRSNLYPGDTLITGPNGIAQVRMLDSASISFSENTEFTFLEYVPATSSGLSGRVTLELHRGGFRTITGLIAGDVDNDYRLVTPDVDVVSARATYQCTYVNDRTYCGVSDGGITLSNSAGMFMLGLGSDFDYAGIENRQTPPVGLLQSPAEFSVINSPPTGLPQTTSMSPPKPASQLTTGTSVAPAQTGNITGFPEPQPIRVKPYKNP